MDDDSLSVTFPDKKPPAAGSRAAAVRSHWPDISGVFWQKIWTTLGHYTSFPLLFTPGLCWVTTQQIKCKSKQWHSTAAGKSNATSIQKSLLLLYWEIIFIFAIQRTSCICGTWDVITRKDFNYLHLCIEKYLKTQIWFYVSYNTFSMAWYQHHCTVLQDLQYYLGWIIHLSHSWAW